MPIYEYKCKCGGKKETWLPFGEFNTPQICECGETMWHKISLPNIAAKPTGRQMALDSLNAKGGGFPDGRYKAGAQQITAAGLEKPAKTIW